MAQQRLQKVLAQAGIASRRKAEIIIAEGRVRVNGEIVTEPGTKADLDRDKIEVDGKPLKRPKAWTYILLNKPDGVVTTASDEFNRKTVLDLLKGVDVRVFPVGRLDLDAEGLLLLTNDGQLAAALTHPAGEVNKTYRVKVRGRPTDDALANLMTGVILEDGLAQAAFVHRTEVAGPRNSRENTWVELTVTEGRNHLVKRMFDAIGHPVVRLRRVALANLDLNGVQPGRWRHLRREELRKLKAVSRTARRKRDARQKGIDLPEDEA
jgi:pseudouridine synthase